MSDPQAPPRGEFEFVRRLGRLLAPGQPGVRQPRARAGVPFGDDMCVVAPDQPELLWTVDMLMDGVDFDSRVHTWRAIGRKALAVNLSDCAAMAVEPVSALCAVALANTLTMEDALDLLRGVQECGQSFHCPIVGGDTNSWDAPTVVSVSVAARCEAGRTPVRRDGARPGDRIWLTGPVGGSLLGRHMTFEPRIGTALAIARRLAPHALIDISDGLAVDLGRILEASHCGGTISVAALDAAVHPDAVRMADQDGRPARTHALEDGEDFELIVVLAADAPDGECAALGLLPLGQIISDAGLWLEERPGQRTPIPIRGWEHFR